MGQPLLKYGARAVKGLALATALGACTTVGPDFQPLETPQLPSSWHSEELASARLSIRDWWQQFDDPTLNQLVDQGAGQNLSLEAAGLRIVQARAALGISDALVFPQQQRVAGNVGTAYSNESSFNSAAIGLDVGWEMDIWGKYARGIESAEASLYASIASYRDVLVSLCAEIARNYISYRTAEQREALSRQNIAIQQRVVDMTQVQYEAGNVSELDVQQAKTQLYATQSSLPGLRIQRLQTMNAIAVLLGTLPENIEPLLARSSAGDLATANQSLLQTSDAGDQALQQTSRTSVDMQQYNAESVIPASPPVDTRVDAQLILQRPDLQVAELRARAQSARIGVREADLYPQFFLAGSIGLAETVASGNGFSASNAVNAAIGPGFSWNIFQYDRIKNQVRIEDASFQESLTNYNQNALEAVREVSNALIAYHYTLEKSKLDFRAVQASIRAFNISANQYNNGLVSYQRLSSTVEKMTLREDVYAQTQGNIANQVIALYKALGGGWQAYETMPVIDPETARQMLDRTDWGDYLEAESLSGENRGE